MQHPILTTLLTSIPKSMNYKLLDKALIFAAKAHDGQYRKGADIPYFAHPVALAMILLDLNCDDELIIAALLHDVVEDTKVTLADIKTTFGSKVADIVQAVSEPNRNAPWEVRKQHTINKLKEAPLPIKLLACADKLHNISAIVRDYNQLGENLWQRFNRGKEKQAWYYRSLAKSLPHDVTELDKYPIFNQFVQEVYNLFGEE